MTGTATPAGSEPVRRRQPPKWRTPAKVVGPGVCGSAIWTRAAVPAGYGVPRNGHTEAVLQWAAPPAAKRSRPVAEGSG